MLLKLKYNIKIAIDPDNTRLTIAKNNQPNDIKIT